jgi:uncharacterized membrane protein YfcA
MIVNYLAIVLIVGFVTAGLNIRFDRFFLILLLLFMAGHPIVEAVNIYLWVIMAGAALILWKNRDKIKQLPRQMKAKLFTVIPLLTLLASLLGSYFFSISSSVVLLNVLGVLAVLYGLRLIFIHFRPEELDSQAPVPSIAKLCGLLGPILSGFFVGFIGTSLKPLKIPFPVRAGKMNARQVYMGNAATTFFSSLFAIGWHVVFSHGAAAWGSDFFRQALTGVLLWIAIHVVSLMTDKVFKDAWRKPFQIIIGVGLVLASVKIFP